MRSLGLWAWLVFLGLLSAAPTLSESSRVLNAWDLLGEEHPSLVQHASAIERELLQLLTPDQLRDYLAGASPAEVVLANGETLEVFLQQRGAGSFDISWFSIDGGGGESSGGAFVLHATIGQPDAGVSTGGIFSLTGGFWALEATSSKLYCDGFESGDISNWSTAAP